MSERFEIQEKEYTLPKENLIGVQDDSFIRRNLKEFIKGLEIEGIKLPIELQGNGNDLVDRKEFAVVYPLGDLFASFVVTIHELGHLRQFDADKEIEYQENRVNYPGKEGKVIVRDAKLRQDKKSLEIKATKRGWQRVIKYASDMLSILEKRFQEHKEQGKLGKFVTFKEFYDYLFRALGIMEDFFFENSGEREMDEQYGREMAQRIKEHPEAYEFFTNQDIWRVGKMVDQQEIENFIKKIADKIAAESYQ